MTTSTGPRTLPVSASVRVRGLLAAPERPASVVAAGPGAVYLSIGHEVVAVVAAGGVRLPCALMLPAGAGPVAQPVPGGGSVVVGAGTVAGLRVDGRPAAMTVARWFDPSVLLRGYDPAAVARLADLLGLARPAGGRSPSDDALGVARPAAARSPSADLVGGGSGAATHADPAPPAGASGGGPWRGLGLDPSLPPAAVDRLAAVLAGALDARAVVGELVGRGAGLTPSGDDLLAGALAALRAVGSPAADVLAAAVRAVAPAGTTRLSASLLEAAGAAAVIPPADGVLRALASGQDRVDSATRALLGVGHTSGWHLAAGLASGAAHACASARTSAIRRTRPHGGVLAAAGSGGTGGLA